jgi:hypothetical protein
MLSGSQVIPVSVVPWILLVLVALVAPGAMVRADGEPSDVGLIRTAKERLGVKAEGTRREPEARAAYEFYRGTARPTMKNFRHATRSSGSVGSIRRQPADLCTIHQYC